MQPRRSYLRIVIPIALAAGLGLFTRHVALERTHSFSAMASLVELTGIFIALCLWIAARELQAKSSLAEMSARSYALLASSVLWMPIVATAFFYAGYRF